MQSSVAPSRRLWQWVNFVFNRVDHSRVHAVGPDRAAAEWILRLGGAMRFSGLVDSWSTDYNRIPSGELRLQAIDASGLSITNNGLEHLTGLKDLRVLRLSHCKYLGDEGLPHLAEVRLCLRELDLSHCYAISERGLPSLYCLSSLHKLDLSNTAKSRNREFALSQLQAQLPQCSITTEPQCQ